MLASLKSVFTHATSDCNCVTFSVFLALQRSHYAEKHIPS